jgi:hypothetical protein
MLGERTCRAPEVGEKGRRSSALLDRRPQAANQQLAESAGLSHQPHLCDWPVHHRSAVGGVPGRNCRGGLTDSSQQIGHSRHKHAESGQYSQTSYRNESASSWATDTCGQQSHARLSSSCRFVDLVLEVELGLVDISEHYVGQPTGGVSDAVRPSRTVWPT